MAFGIVLNIFLVFLFIVYWIVVFLILYHLSRFGVGVQPKKFAAIFLFGTVVLFSFALAFYVNFDVRTLQKLI